MNFFRKLFGAKPASPAPSDAPSAADSSAAAPAPAGDAEIRAHDAYGREILLSREQWRDSGLLPHLEKVRAQPDALAAALGQALNDGFAADVLPFAEHLAQTDANAERGHVLHAAALLALRRLDEAETVLNRFVEKHGDGALALTHLAKIRFEQGDRAAALDLLWRALRIDPNQELALPWLAALEREKHGEPSELAAYRRVADLPDAWRARLWLARKELEQRQLPAALKLYDEALERAPRPVPVDLLQQMSGDLGNHAHLPELLQLVAPYYDITLHGLGVGGNILKAYHDLGRLDAARNLLNRLYAQNRPDWKPHLAAWETELARTRRSIDEPPAPGKIEVTLLAVEGPVWLPPDSPATELYPAKATDSLLVAFLGGSAELPSANGSQPPPQLADAAGRFSRALPLYLTEQLEFGSAALGRTLVPWMVKPQPGFLLGGVPWDDATAARHARACVPDDPADYLVVTHLKCTSQPWLIEVRLVRTIDGVRLATGEVPCPTASPAQALPELTRLVSELLARHADIPPCPATYEASLPPPPVSLPYLMRLEQLLAVRTAGIDPAKAPAHGEREVLEGQLRLCLDHPDNLPVRLLFAHTLAAMKRVRPEVLPEFRARVELLQADKALPEPARAVTARVFAMAFAG